MTALVWDQSGEREFHVGIDRGVLYLPGSPGVAWNGLTGFEDSTDSELKEYYLDGYKYLAKLTPGEFSGKLTAFTYPEEFDSVNGSVTVESGLVYHDQLAKSFGLSYRTKIGDDLVGSDKGYTIHLLYNVLAKPDNRTYETMGETVDPAEFGWILSAKPVKITGFVPTSRISIKSTGASLTALENELYGTSGTDPRLPSISELPTLL